MATMVPHSRDRWTARLLLRITCGVKSPLKDMMDAMANRSGHVQAIAHTATAAITCHSVRRNRQVSSGTNAPPDGRLVPSPQRPSPYDGPTALSALGPISPSEPPHGVFIGW